MTREEAIRILASSCIPGSKQTEALETLIPELRESEDERMLRLITEGFKNYSRSASKWNNCPVDEIIAWLEKQKPAEWSEEDVKRLYSIGTEIGFLKGRYSEWQKDIDWLYALAEKMGLHKCKIGEVVTEWKKEGIDDKMLSKPKPEWSEEDEKYLNRVINLWVNDFGEDSDTVKWLKSLRPSWKPNDEDEVRLINTSISFLKDFANKGYENAVECIDWLKSKLNGNSGK